MKITRFEEFIERAVPYFIGIALLAIFLIMINSCASYPNQSKVIKPRSEAKATFR